MIHEWGVVLYYCTPVCRLRIQNWFSFLFLISIMQHAIKAASLTVWWRRFNADVLKLSVLNTAKGQTWIPETQKQTERNKTATETDALFHATQWVRTNKTAESSFRTSGTVTSANASTESEPFPNACICTVFKAPQGLKRICKALNFQTLTFAYLIKMVTEMVLLAVSMLCVLRECHLVNAAAAVWLSRFPPGCTQSTEKLRLHLWKTKGCDGFSVTIHHSDRTSQSEYRRRFLGRSSNHPSGTEKQRNNRKHRSRPA